MAAEQSDRPPVSWPKTLGIIMIIFGSLGILCNGSSMYANYGYRALRALHEMAAKAGKGSALTSEQLEFLREPLMHNWNLVLTTLLGLCAVLAVVLLACGIGMVGRHAWTVRISTTWAGIKIVLELVTAMGGWVVQQKIVHAIQAGILKEEAVPGELLETSVAGLSGQIALGVVFPIFVLIWLSLPNTREETAGWA
jgi:hypothetical protein